MLVIQDDMYPDYLFCIAWQRQLASVNTQYTTAWQLQLDLLIVELLFTRYFSSFSLFILFWSSVWNFHNLVRVVLRFWAIFYIRNNAKSCLFQSWKLKVKIANPVWPGRCAVAPAVPSVTSPCLRRQVVSPVKMAADSTMRGSWKLSVIQHLMYSFQPSLLNQFMSVYKVFTHSEV